MRFERSSPPVSSCKLFGRNEVNSRLSFERALDRGAFLALLWAHFGAPTTRDGGFEYHLRDRQTGLVFTAFAGPNPPSYAGDLALRKALFPVIEALEQQLDTTTPATCAMLYAHGGGQRVLGFRDGRSYDIEDRRGRKPAVKDRRAG